MDHFYFVDENVRPYQFWTAVTGSKLRELALKIFSIAPLAGSIESALSRVAQQPSTIFQSDLAAKNEFARVRQHVLASSTRQLAPQVAQHAMAKPLSRPFGLRRRTKKATADTNIYGLLRARRRNMWAEPDDQLADSSEKLQQMEGQLRQHGLDGSAWLASIYFDLSAIETIC